MWDRLRINTRLIGPSQVKSWLPGTRGGRRLLLQKFAQGFRFSSDEPHRPMANQLSDVTTSRSRIALVVNLQLEGLNAAIVPTNTGLGTHSTDSVASFRE